LLIIYKYQHPHVLTTASAKVKHHKLEQAAHIYNSDNNKAKTYKIIVIMLGD